MNAFNLILALLVSIPAAAHEPQWLSHDFSLVEAPADWQGAPALAPHNLEAPADPRADCEAHLRQALCVANESMENITRKWNRIPCDPDSASFLPAAMEIYDEMPERVRPLYCSLEKIFLSDKLWSIAFASSVVKNGKVVGAFVGARKSSFVSDLKASALITWKEQMIFGGSKDFLANDPASVQLKYKIRLERMKSDGLFYVMMHELGHIVDFQNNANRKWAPISWRSDSPRREARFEYQDRVCFYNCSSSLRLARAYPMYESIRESAFITTYSGVNSYEDFAEFWTWNILRQFKDVDYRIEVPGQPELDMNGVFANPKVTKKMDFIRALWDSQDTKIGF